MQKKNNFRAYKHGHTTYSSPKGRLMSPHPLVHLFIFIIVLAKSLRKFAARTRLHSSSPSEFLKATTDLYNPKLPGQVPLAGQHKPGRSQGGAEATHCREGAEDWRGRVGGLVAALENEGHAARSHMTEGRETHVGAPPCACASNKDNLKDGGAEQALKRSRDVDRVGFVPVNRPLSLERGYEGEDKGEVKCACACVCLGGGDEQEKVENELFALPCSPSEAHATKSLSARSESRMIPRTLLYSHRSYYQLSAVEVDPAFTAL